MKTIEEWYEEVKQTTLRERLFDNLDDNLRFQHSNKLTDAIKNGFVWSDTPEGILFWKDVYLQSERGGL